jgi:hypothetical protein
VTSGPYAYDAAFMGVTAQAQRSAELVVRLLQRELAFHSVADFGCALGTWLAVWRAAGVADIAGVDGAYVDRRRLAIPAGCFHARDLAQPIDLGRRFDLVQSLEVAEHLPGQAARGFVETLTRHGELVLFSAAPPGQGGEHHVNEQPYEYWRALFAAQGYALIDWLRPQLASAPQVQYWYRYNLFLFATAERLKSLPETLRRAVQAEGEPVADLSPLSFRLRKRLLRRVPSPLQDRLSRALSRLRGRGSA